MASTNKTINYELSQYIGTDKPTYLGDYNNDMLKIDIALKNNADAVNTASTNATNAVNTANTASTNATNAVNTANSASTEATSALNKAINNEAQIANFNLTSYENITTFSRVGSGSVRNDSIIYVAKNSDGSLAKIYGQITITGVTDSASNPGKLTFNTSLRPSSNITIVGGAICMYQSSSQVVTNYIKEFTIKTNGDVEIEYNYNQTSGQIWRAMFINSLIFVKDFGDAPIPE